MIDFAHFSHKEVVELVKQVLHENEKELKACEKVDGSYDLEALQVWVEKTLSKHSREDFVLEYVIPQEDQEEMVETAKALGLNPHALVYFHTKLQLHRRLNEEVAANQLNHFFKEPEETQAFIEACKEHNLVKWDARSSQFTALYEWTADAEIRLDMLQSLLPSVCPPKKIRLNANKTRYLNGYQTLKEGIFSKKADPHLDVDVQFLNNLNRTKYYLNYDVYFKYIQHHPYIPKWEDCVDEDTQERVDAKEYKKRVADAWRFHWRRDFILTLFYTLGIKYVHLLNFFGANGRNYCKGFLISTQGRDADKALLLFEPEALTPEGITWCSIYCTQDFNPKINGVSADKTDFDSNLDWFKQNVAPLFVLDQVGFENALFNLAEGAESPAQFIAKAMELYKTFRIPGYKSGVICHADECQSAYKLQAIFAEDWEIAKLTNTHYFKKIYDFYTYIYSELLKRGIPDTYSRNEIKKGCLVPAAYNSVKCIRTTFPSKKHQKVFDDVMGEYPTWQLNRLFPSLMDLDAMEDRIMYPDGFIGVEKYKRQLVSEHTSNISGKYYEIYKDEYCTLRESMGLPAGKDAPCRKAGPKITHGCDGFCIREEAKRAWFTVDMLDYKKHVLKHVKNVTKQVTNKVFLRQLEAARKTDYYTVGLLWNVCKDTVGALTQEERARLLEVCNEISPMSYSVTLIHDSVGCHPNYMSDLQKQERYTLYHLSKSCYINSAVKDLSGHELEGWTYNSDKFSELILKGKYGFR